MLTQTDFQKLRANQGYLAEELQNRGLTVQVLDWDNELIEARLDKHSEIIFGIDSTIMPFSSSVISASKSITKRLLQRAGLEVPNGFHFRSEDAVAAIEVAQSIVGFPLVAKPSVGIQGEDVHTAIEDPTELAAVINSIEENRGPCEIILERHCLGREYRLFITKHGQFAAVERDPAHIIGDGKNNIESLAKIESERRLNPRLNCLDEIIIDQEVLRHLKRTGFSLSAVPKRGQKIYLRNSSNIKLGGVAIDVTDLVHPDYVEIGQRALAALNNMPYAGLDIISLDISLPPSKAGYNLIELNSVPGLGIHMAPGLGQPRNVAGMIADLIFPETLEQSILPLRIAI